MVLPWISMGSFLQVRAEMFGMGFCKGVIEKSECISSVALPVVVSGGEARAQCVDHALCLLLGSTPRPHL